MARKVDHERIAYDVGMCWGEHSEKIDFLADFLYILAKGTRWEDDAISAIQGACPQYFKDSDIEPDCFD